MLMQILKCMKILSLKWDPGFTKLTDVMGKIHGRTKKLQRVNSLLKSSLLRELRNF